MPSRRVCLVGGIACIVLAVLAAYFGWFIFEPLTERRFLPQDMQDQQSSDVQFEAIRLSSRR